MVTTYCTEVTRRKGGLFWLTVYRRHSILVGEDMVTREAHLGGSETEPKVVPGLSLKAHPVIYIC